MSQAIQAFHLVWTLTALLVGALFAVRACRRWRERIYDDVTWMLIGISIGFIGGGLNRAWFTVWRWLRDRGDDVAWMADSPAVAGFALLILVGAIIHLRTATRHKCRNFWLFWVALMTAVGVAMAVPVT